MTDSTTTPLNEREEWYRLRALALDDELAKLQLKVTDLEAQLRHHRDLSEARARTISTMLKAQGLPSADDSRWNAFNGGTKVGRPYKLTPEMLLTAHKLHHEQGLTAYAIAKTLNCDKGVVRLFLRREYTTAAALEAYRILGLKPMAPAFQEPADVPPPQNRPAQARNRC